MVWHILINVPVLTHLHTSLSEEKINAEYRMILGYRLVQTCWAHFWSQMYSSRKINHHTVRNEAGSKGQKLIKNYRQNNKLQIFFHVIFSLWCFSSFNFCIYLFKFHFKQEDLRMIRKQAIELDLFLFFSIYNLPYILHRKWKSAR